MKQRTKFGAVSIAITAVVLVLLVGVNVALSLLGDSRSLQWDLTQSKAFVVSDEIVEIFKSIETPVQITVLIDEDEFRGAGPYFAQAHTVMKTAEEVNPNISMRYVDPIANPDIQAQYPELTLSRGNIVVTNLETGYSIQIYIADLYVLVGSTISESRAEEGIASALVRVTSERLIKVTFTTGHNEEETEQLRSLLELNNYVVSQTDMMTDTIGDDIGVIVIVAPKTDYGEDEIIKLEQFLFNNGDYGKSILYFASADQSPLPVLEGFLENYGLSVRQGMVWELASDRNTGDPRNGYPQYETETYQADIKLGAPYVRPIDILYSESGSVSVTPLLGYTDTALVQPADAGEDWVPDEGSIETLYAAVKATQNGGTLTDKKESNVIVFGTWIMVEDDFITSSNIGNAEFFLKVFDGITENANTINVTPKSLTGARLYLTAAQTTALAVVFIGVVPAAVIILGIVVYLRRRNK